MKKLAGLLILVAVILHVFADGKLNLYLSDKSVFSKETSTIDSIYFTDNQSILNIRQSTSLISYPIATIDSITFEESNPVVKIIYSNNSVLVENPFENNGVSITTSGAEVTVNSINTTSVINYELSGNTTSGMFKIYSLVKFGLNLNNVSITNMSGPAINIQSKKTVSINSMAGTVNVLTDGNTYTTTVEDQKSTIFSEGRIDFGGSGKLTVKSIAKHAICSDDTIQITSGNIVVEAAGKDGIHSKSLFACTGGTLSINASGDGIESELGDLMISGGSITTTNAVADSKGITCDYNMTISGGTITQTLSGVQTKGLRSKQLMTITGGTITVNTTGNVGLIASGSGSEPS